MIQKIDLTKIIFGLLIYVFFGGFLYIFSVEKLTALQISFLPLTRLLEFNLVYISLFIISMFISFKYVELEE